MNFSRLQEWNRGAHPGERISWSFRNVWTIDTERTELILRVVSLEKRDSIYTCGTSTRTPVFQINSALPYSASRSALTSLNGSRNSWRTQYTIPRCRFHTRYYLVIRHQKRTYQTLNSGLCGQLIHLGSRFLSPDLRLIKYLVNMVSNKIHA